MTSRTPKIQKCIDLALSRPGECVLWVGSVMKNGYGRCGWQGKVRLAHRVVWALDKGLDDIQSFGELDHLCRNRSCVNPSHLEEVTRKENIVRSNSLSAINSRKTHCKNGHEFAGENLIINKSGSRSCRICSREHWRKVSRKKGSPERSFSNEERCANGHEWTKKNTYVTKKGKKECRTCRSISSAKSKRRNKEKDIS